MEAQLDPPTPEQLGEDADLDQDMDQDGAYLSDQLAQPQVCMLMNACWRICMSLIHQRRSNCSETCSAQLVIVTTQKL